MDVALRCQRGDVSRITRYDKLPLPNYPIIMADTYPHGWDRRTVTVAIAVAVAYYTLSRTDAYTACAKCHGRK